MLDSQVLTNCVTQTVAKLLKNCFDVLIEEITAMTCGEFKSVSAAKAAAGIHFNNENEAEDNFWQQLGSGPNIPYGINIPKSLFGDETIVWNMNKFTKNESNIHTTPSHQLLKV